MDNKTGYAPGKLNPIVYFERADGELALPPSTKDAHWLWNHGKDTEGRSLRENGWELREASTLAEVDKLQVRLQDLEVRRMRPKLERHQEIREAVRKQVASDLYSRMISAGTSAYEKEFIKLYLELRESKRDKYRESFEHRQMYLHAREMDENTLGTDRLGE